MQVHSSDLDPEQLRRLLADQVARDQAREVRRYFLVRIGAVAAAIWLFSWPIPLLPHTVLWALAAAVVFAYALMSPPQTRRATRHTPRTPPR